MNNFSMYFTAAGLFGLAIYQVSTKEYPGAVQSVLAALAVLGINVSQRVILKKIEKP